MFDFKIAEKFCSSTPSELGYLVEFLVEDFALHVHWRRRQMFINICQEMVSSSIVFHLKNLFEKSLIRQQISKDNSPSFEIIEENFLPHILELAKDKIPNIRLAVVRLLSSLISLNPHLLTMLDRKCLLVMEFSFYLVNF